MNSNEPTEYFDAYSAPMEHNEWLSLEPHTEPESLHTSPLDCTDRPPIGPRTMAQIRWETINMGFIQTLLKMWLINITDKVAVSLTIVITALVSIFDTIADIVVAYTLFISGHRTWGTIVVLCDYIPSWQLAVHNFFSSKWQNINKKEKIVATIFLALSPFSMPLFFIRWLMKFESEDLVFNYLHHNARLSHLLNCSLENPIQVIILLVLWGEGKLTLPWNETTTVTDTVGRIIPLYNGTISLAISLLMIVKGSLEVAEERKWIEQIEVCAYAICNFAFRLPSFALAII